MNNQETTTAVLEPSNTLVASSTIFANGSNVTSFKIKVEKGKAYSIEFDTASGKAPEFDLQVAADTYKWPSASSDSEKPELTTRIKFEPIVSGDYIVTPVSTGNGIPNFTIKFIEEPNFQEASLARLADYLINDSNTYFKSPTYLKWDLPASGSGREITYSLDNQSAEVAQLAEWAFQAWSDITNIKFRKVDSGGKITFDSESEGADADPKYSGKTITSVNISINPSVYENDSTLGGEGYETFLHEIGHALGLGHTGPYNGYGQYAYSAEFSNDTKLLSAMSYFGVNERPFDAQSVSYTLTPMPVDYLAMKELYGVVDVNAGDTYYGQFGKQTTDATLPTGILGQYLKSATDSADTSVKNDNVIYTIFDSGGIDWIDAREAKSQTFISLQEKGTSEFGPHQFHLIINPGSVIENAVGGRHDDEIIGNASANSLHGGYGADIIEGGGGNDRMTGGVGVDTFSFDKKFGSDSIKDADGGVLRFNEFSQSEIVYLKDGQSLVAESALSFSQVKVDDYFADNGSWNVRFKEGAEVSLSSLLDNITDVSTRFETVFSDGADFNSDGKKDVVLFNETSGKLGGLSMPSKAWKGLGEGESGWKAVAHGNLDADAAIETLWYNATTKTIGQVVNNEMSTISRGSGAWELAALADFDGDNDDDVLWVNASTNQIGQFRMQDGTSSWQTIGKTGANWNVVGVGDFNKDQTDDLLMFNSATGRLGQFRLTADSAEWRGLSRLGQGWEVTETGDFDGDGFEDILLFNSSTRRLGQFDMDDGTPRWIGMGTVGTGWNIESTGDYNGDGRDDILLRNESTGSIGQYIMDGADQSWSFIGSSNKDWDIV